MSSPYSPDQEEILRNLVDDLEEPTRQAWIDVLGPSYEASDAFAYNRGLADPSIIGVDATVFLHLSRIILKSSDHFAHIVALSPALSSTFLIMGAPLVKQLVDLVGVARRTTESAYQASVTPGISNMWHPPPACFTPDSAVSILDEVLRSRAAESNHAFERLLSVDSVTELYRPSDDSVDTVNAAVGSADSSAGSSAAHAAAASPDVRDVAFSAPSSPVTDPRAEREPPPPPKRRRASSASRVG